MEPGTEFRMEQSFSERLKRYRKERNLTQQQLADALGVSNKSVSRWESGGGYPDVPLLVPLFISAFRRANDLAMAMEARCYHGGEGRTQMKPLIYQKRDYVAYGIVWAYLAVSIVFRVLGI